MMAAAINVDHRRHRFPFAGAARVDEARGGILSLEDRSTRETGIYDRQLHAVIIADSSRKSFDSSQALANSEERWRTTAVQDAVATDPMHSSAERHGLRRPSAAFPTSTPRTR